MDGLSSMAAQKILRYVQLFERGEKMGGEFSVFIALVDFRGCQVFFAPLVHSFDDLSFLLGNQRQVVQIGVGFLDELLGKLLQPLCHLLEINDVINYTY